jgi:4-coumarate--CoA ligase
LPAAVAAAQSAGIPLDRVVVLSPTNVAPHATVEELVTVGLSKPPAFIERRLAPGEAKRKLAFLCFSSGTTGKPKAVEVSHYSMISNVIQGKQLIGKEPRYKQGDVVLGGKLLLRVIWYPLLIIPVSPAVLP